MMPLEKVWMTPHPQCMAHKVFSWTIWVCSHPWPTAYPVCSLKCGCAHTHDVIIIIIINPLTVKVVGAPQMISQPVSSIFLCSQLARPDERETYPYHCSLCLFTMVRSSWGLTACWILARTHHMIRNLQCTAGCGTTLFIYLIIYWQKHLNFGEYMWWSVVDKVMKFHGGGMKFWANSECVHQSMGDFSPVAFNED